MPRARRLTPSAPEPSFPAPAEPESVLRSGFIETRRVLVCDLVANPENIREHPPEQAAALRESLAYAGPSKPLILNETTGRLVDGHLRLQVMQEDGETWADVNVGRWTEAQERYLLAVLDPITAMARINSARFASLRDRLPIGPDMGPATARLLDAMHTDPFFTIGLGARFGGNGAPVPAPEPAPPAEFPTRDETLPTDYQCPSCGFSWSGQGAPGVSAGEDRGAGVA